MTEPTAPGRSASIRRLRQWLFDLVAVTSDSGGANAAKEGLGGLRRCWAAGLVGVLFASALVADPGAVSGQSGPSVASVAVSSAPGSGDTYLLGETIEVTVTFSEAVNVTGAPRLRIDMDPAHWGRKWARYAEGSGTSALVFAHEVVQPNISTQGIAVLANTLRLNGGTIQSVSSGTDAALGHDGLDHDPDHKVDWRRTPPPPPPVVAPGGLTGLSTDAEQGSLSVSLEWDDVDGADDYLVRWRLAGPGNALNDGIRATSASAEITVADSGDWVVRVEACNSAGCGPAAAKRFTVQNASEETPALEVTAEAQPSQPATGDTVTLSASVANAPAGSEPSYQWQTRTSGAWADAGTAATLSYESEVPLSVTFRLTVVYDSGERAASAPLAVTWTGSDGTDYDTDDDGLIEVSGAAQLNAIRWDLDGDGTVAQADESGYEAAFEDAQAGMGCGDTDGDNNPGPCTGYELDADITLSTAIAPTGVSGLQTWAPVGTSSDPYQAELDGNGYVIRNLIINRPDLTEIGLFGALGGNAEVKNLGIISPIVTGGKFRLPSLLDYPIVRYMGALAARSKGRVSSVAVRGGKVIANSGGNARVGGLVGELEANGSITNSYSRAMLWADGFCARDIFFGGVAARVTGSATISDTYWAGMLDYCIPHSDHTNAGGVAGRAPETNSVSGSYYERVPGLDDRDNGRGIAKEEDELKVGATSSEVYTGWNVEEDQVTGEEDIWDLKEGFYPRLSFEKRYDGFQTGTALELGSDYYGMWAPEGLRADGKRYQTCYSNESGETRVQLVVRWEHPSGYRIQYTVDGWETFQQQDRYVDDPFTTVNNLMPDREYIFQLLVTGRTEQQGPPSALVVNTRECAPPEPAVGTAGSTDHDTDDDGLIEVANAVQLKAIRWDLNGDGTADYGEDQTVYGAAFADAQASMGCGDTDGDNNPGPCTGYELAADITLSPSITPWGLPGAQTWVPVGTSSGPYQAELEGNGYVIWNLVINRPDLSSVGLFGALGSSAEVSDLGIIAPYVRGGQNAGALAGESQGDVERVAVRGGLVHSHGSIGDSGMVGGLVGKLGDSGSITDSYSKAEATLTAECQSARYYVGSLVGGVLQSGTITDSYAAGGVEGCDQAARGGVVGTVPEDSDSVDASYYDWVLGRLRLVEGHGISKSTAQLKVAGPSDDVFTGWSVETRNDQGDVVTAGTWAMKEGFYPRLSFEKRYDEFLTGTALNLGSDWGLADAPLSFRAVPRTWLCRNGGTNLGIWVRWDQPDLNWGKYTTDGWKTVRTTDHRASPDGQVRMFGLTPGQLNIVQFRLVDGGGRIGPPAVLIVDAYNCGR